MTTRTRSFAPPALVGTVVQTKNGVPTGLVTQQDIFSSEKVIVDTVVEDYYSRRKKGEYINNSMWKSQNLTTCGGGWNRLTKSGTVYENSGSGSLTLHTLTTGTYHGNPPDLITLDLDRMIEIAKFKALSNIDPTPYSFAEDVGELRETVRFLASPMSSLEKLVRSFRADFLSRANNVTRTARRARLLAETYLEYRFAISPLLRSINSLMVSLGGTNYPSRKIRVARGQASLSDLQALDWTHVPYSGAQFFYEIVDEVDVKVRAYIHYRETDPVRDWRWKYGLRLKDVPETLWAICPYSFLVDRVANISDGLRGLTNLLDPGITFLGAGVSTQVTRTKSVTWTGGTQTGYTVSGVGDTVLTNSSSYERNVWEPNVGDTRPPVNIGGLVADITKMADLAALIATNVRLR